MSSRRLYTRISAPRQHESLGAVCHHLPSASVDITHQGFRVTSGLIFKYVTFEAMLYMYNVDLSDHYVDLSEK